jgi:peptide/nickel transport system substrate-binding protein
VTGCSGDRRVGRRAWLLAMGIAGSAAALGRTPYGGKLDLRLPWPLGSLDPHAVDDAVAALFGPAVADPLFGVDSRGRPYPTLADAMPTPTSKGVRVRLRPHLKSARGRGLDARDLLFSWRRSRMNAGAGLLGRFAEPFHDKEDGLAIIVPDADPVDVAKALASPVTALLPRGFSRIRPDGTGAFVANVTTNRLVLERNPDAARGAAYLWKIEATRASDLADALRAFEAEEVDVGWLGNGLHRPRPGAIAFAGPHFGWVVLRSGSKAGAWGAPGVAQGLLDGIAPARLRHLGLEGIPPARGRQKWGGEPADLLFPNDSPHLAQVARSLASLLSTPDHTLTPRGRSGAEIDQRKARADYVLLVDFVRKIGSAPPDTLLSLLTAVDPSMARRPPRLAATTAREVARTLPLGVVGELHIRGARVPNFQKLDDWDLGAVYQQG